MFRQLVCDCSIYVVSCCVLVCNCIRKILTGFNPLTIDISCCTTLEYFLLRFCRRWVMCFVGIIIINTIVYPCDVIDRLSINILIYLYGKLDCYFLILSYINRPLNYSTRLCSAILSVHKLCMCRKLICDCSIYIFSCCILIGNRICKFLSGFNPLTVDICSSTTLEYLFLRLCRRWVMCLICIRLIEIIFYMRYIINRFTIYIVIYFYLEANSPSFSVFDFVFPSDNSAGFSS